MHAKVEAGSGPGVVGRYDDPDDRRTLGVPRSWDDWPAEGRRPLASRSQRRRRRATLTCRFAAEIAGSRAAAGPRGRPLDRHARPRGEIGRHPAAAIPRRRDLGRDLRCTASDCTFGRPDHAADLGARARPRRARTSRPSSSAARGGPDEPPRRGTRRDIPAIATLRPHRGVLAGRDAAALGSKAPARRRLAASRSSARRSRSRRAGRDAAAWSRRPHRRAVPPCSPAIEVDLLTSRTRGSRPATTACCARTVDWWCRAADLTHRRAERTYLAEIESHLRLFPTSAGCAVVGAGDERWGEVVGVVLGNRRRLRRRGDPRPALLLASQ